MTLAWVKLASILFVVMSAEGLRRERGITGDPVPPPYPVVNVHVSEPAMNAADFKSAAIAHQHKQGSLLQLEEHVALLEKQTLATMATLAEQVKSVGDLIGSHIQA